MAKEKKWTKYRGVFPQYIPRAEGDKNFAEKVDAAKKCIASFPNEVIGKSLDSLKKEKKHCEKKVKALNVEIEACQSVLADRFINLQIQSQKMSTGQLLYLKDEPYASVKDKEAFIKWLKENDMEEFLSPQWQSVNAMVKERIEADLPIPPGVEVFLKTTVISKGQTEDNE